jgi:hypothetical protein
MIRSSLAVLTYRKETIGWKIDGNVCQKATPDSRVTAFSASSIAILAHHLNRSLVAISVLYGANDLDCLPDDPYSETTDSTALISADEQDQDLQGVFGDVEMHQVPDSRI